MLINGVAAILWQLPTHPPAAGVACRSCGCSVVSARGVPATVVCLADVSVLADRVAGRYDLYSPGPSCAGVENYFVS